MSAAWAGRSAWRFRRFPSRPGEVQKTRKRQTEEQSTVAASMDDKLKQKGRQSGRRAGRQAGQQASDWLDLGPEARAPQASRKGMGACRPLQVDMASFGLYRRRPNQATRDFLSCAEPNGRKPGVPSEAPD